MNSTTVEQQHDRKKHKIFPFFFLTTGSSTGNQTQMHSKCKDLTFPHIIYTTHHMLEEVLKIPFLTSSSKTVRPLLKRPNVQTSINEQIRWKNGRNLSLKTEEWLSVKLLSFWEFQLGHIERRIQHVCQIRAKFVSCPPNEEQKGNCINIYQDL